MEDFPPPVDGLSVMPSVGTNKPCQPGFIIGGMSSGRHFKFHEPTLKNAATAVAGRVLTYYKDGEYQRIVQPKSGGFVRWALREVVSTIVKCIPQSPVICAIEDFPYLYTGRKQTLYMNAVASLSTRPLEKRDSHISGFVKREKLWFKPGKFLLPRWISPRSPRYNASVGRYLKPNEKLILCGVDRMYGERTVAKGLTAQQTGRLIAKKFQSFDDPVAVGIDAAKFDEHVSREIMEHFEHRVYNGVFRSAELAELLTWQLTNTGVGYCVDGKLKYKRIGGRASGDMNTGLGNCLIMCGLLFKWMSITGVNFKLINNGDDCVAFMERKDLGRFTKGFDRFFLDMGFRMVVEEPVDEIEQVVFCQCQPVWTPDGYLAVRQIATALAKDSMSLIDIAGERMQRSWCTAVGECGMSLTGGIPVMQEVYAAYTASGGPIRKMESHPLYESGMVMMSKGMNRSYAIPDSKTRYSFWRAFGIAPNEQVVMEEYYRSIVVSHNKPLPIENDQFLTTSGAPQSLQYLLSNGS